ncbi:hypothetical protein [Paracoccus sulfuroxidans]|uniref:hypothetical protein n=1 Tax=Paracoccus sulfuroxidans TaxID=384678 RepID=UPI0011A812E6|nr:hypothetical protein [Paracoccus sulfuroxidans]
MDMSAHRIWAGSEVDALWAGGRRWLRPISTLYGLGAGLVPTHYDPAKAGVNGSGEVTSVPNLGAAGAAYGAAPAGTEAIRISGGMFALTGANFLNVPGAPDLMGTRCFIVANLTFPVRITYFLGNIVAGNVGNTNARFDSLTKAILLQRNDGSGNIAAPNLAWPDMAEGLHLIELEILPSTIKLFVGGVQKASVATPAWPNFPVSRIGIGQASPGITGRLGDIVPMVTDGSAAMARPIGIIRRRLAEKHPGLVVA